MVVVTSHKRISIIVKDSLFRLSLVHHRCLSLSGTAYPFTAYWVSGIALPSLYLLLAAPLTSLIS